MATSTTGRPAVMPLTHDFIHTDYEPAVKGLKINKGVVYKHNHTNSNNIDKGNAIHLPFLYQAPSLRKSNGVTLVHQSSSQASSAVSRRRNSRRRNNEHHLPVIPNIPTPSPPSNADSLQLLILKGQTKPLNAKKSSTSETKSRSSKPAKSVKLVDDLSVGSSTDDRRVFGHVGLRQNGIIVKQNGGPSTSTLPALSISLPQRAKSALDVREESSSESDMTLNSLLKPGVDSISTHSLRDTAEIATQTAMFKAVASVEYLGKFKGTQTEALPYSFKSKSDIRSSSEQEEEKEALMSVIEDALEETIDKYSRIRTNQIIARSARKQKEIWKDTKEFFVDFLIPQSIAVANKSRRRQQTAAEIVGGIKMYP